MKIYIAVSKNKLNINEGDVVYRSLEEAQDDIDPELDIVELEVKETKRFRSQSWAEVKPEKNKK